MAPVVSGPQAAQGASRQAPPWGPEQQALLLRRLTLAFLVVGALWRVVRYLLRFPIWGDEAMVCLNFLELDYRGLLRELRYCQVAPLLFLWGELTSLRLLGGSEWALRLLPFLAGLGSLFLFWRLTRLTLRPAEATLALGFLAGAVWPVSMGTFIKPYAFDLFFALVLLVPAAHWLRRPNRLRWLAVLSLVTPPALFGSYPAVFVGGAVSLGLLATAWRRGWKARLLFAAYNLTLVASFLGHYWTVGKGQLRTSAGPSNTELGMQTYWAEGFPPAAPLPLLKWLVLIHTGQMTAYPVGSSNGGSSLTVLLGLAGAWAFWKTGRRALLMLCTAPFALSFLAAVLHRYPYGASGRLTQYLGPAVCLTAGAGAVALIERVRSAAARRRWFLGAGGALLLVALVGLARDVVKPYRDVETRWINDVMRALRAETGPGVPVVVLNPVEGFDSLFRWHLGLMGDRVSWGAHVDWDQAAARGEFYCLLLRNEHVQRPDQVPRATRQVPAEVYPPLAAWVRHSGRPWVLKKAVTDIGVPPSWQDPVKHLDQYHWVLEPEPAARP
jgi:hypothetical protein